MELKKADLGDIDYKPIEDGAKVFFEMYYRYLAVGFNEEQAFALMERSLDAAANAAANTTFNRVVSF